MVLDGSGHSVVIALDAIVDCLQVRRRQNISRVRVNPHLLNFPGAHVRKVADDLNMESLYLPQRGRREDPALAAGV